MSHNFRILKSKIISLSKASTWHQALREWHVESIYIVSKDESEICLCTKDPILELCYLRNNLTGSEALVGNKCVNNFDKIQYIRKYDAVPDVKYDRKHLFGQLRKIIKDINKPLSKKAVEYAGEIGIFDSYDKKFCIDMCRKKSLTAKQANFRRKCNDKFIQFHRAKQEEC